MCAMRLVWDAPSGREIITMSKDNISRLRLERILEIGRLLKQKQPINCSAFARHWKAKFDYTQPLDRKTIQRDLDWMRDMLNAPIAYNPNTKSYYLTEDTWDFPLLQLNEGEYVSLLLARQMGRLYQNTPIAKDLDGFFEKVRTGMTDKVDVDPVFYGNIISFQGRAPQKIEPDVWKSILKGLESGSYLSFVYRSIHDKGEAHERVVGPVHLANINDDWYLMGYCGGMSDEDWRHYSLSRMQDVKILPKPFIPPRPFDPQKFFSGRFGKFIAPPGAKIFMVKLRFTPAIAPYITERVWHPEQQLQVDKDGSVLLTVPIPALDEAKAFCFNWGPDVEVLEPPELIASIKKDIAKMSALYAKA